jgi:hypothetical protein
MLYALPPAVRVRTSVHRAVGRARASASGTGSLLLGLLLGQLVSIRRRLNQYHSLKGGQIAHMPDRREAESLLD